MKDLKPNHVHYMRHVPTNEEWYVMGVSLKGDKICAAGWPPTIANMSDMEVILLNVQPLLESEIQHRRNEFGVNWT